MHGHFSFGIICSSELKVFLVNRFRQKFVRFSEQINSCTNIYAPVIIYLLTSQTVVEFLVSSSYNRTLMISKYPAFYFIKKLNASLAFKSFRREAKGLCKNMAKQINNYRSQLTIIHQSGGVNIYHSSSTLR